MIGTNICKLRIFIDMENKKYSILIIALYCYSGHVQGVIDHLKAVNPLIDVTLLTDNPDDVKAILSDKTTKIIAYDVPQVSIKWRWLRHVIIRHRQCCFFKKFHKGRRFDIVNVHFANFYMSYVYPYLRAMSNKLVITPWGSDILRRDKKHLMRLASLYQKADYIATSSNTPLGKKIIEDLHIETGKLVGNFFGSDLVDYALKHRLPISIEEAKERFGLSGRYVITCGYNRREPQRHKAIISAISKVREELPENLSLLFPMQIGLETRPDYMDECKKECEINNLPAVFVTRFLSVEELYLLRMATDMFIHVQTTDASSSTIKEYVLCDKKIVHGSWIRYEDLEAFRPLFYFPVDRLEDLGEVIAKACHSEKVVFSQGLLDYIRSGGWERKATQLNDFFQSII